MEQEVAATDTGGLLNYKINLWRLESLLDKLKVAQANHKRPDFSLSETAEILRWAVTALKSHGPD